MAANMVKPFLLAMLPVRNEAGRYLATVLTCLSEYVDGIVILDDASTDETPAICQRFKKVIRFHHLTEPLFWKNESKLRQLLWEMTVEFDPAWILAIDADEVFESRICRELPLITRQEHYDLFYFPVYHFWGSLDYYRVDGLWDPLFSKMGCLYRYRKELTYHWSDRKLHCSRFPLEAKAQPATLSSVRLLHLGYLQKKDHHPKFKRYLAADPNGDYCPIHHYHSIISEPCRLKKWRGEKVRYCHG